ncbi:MAG: ABC transporter ATP-binding protein [Lachnospiraceae bacterium]|nr:ABC transporter ATP-binding protein [Lachnospiraceae bacterium]
MKFDYKNSGTIKLFVQHYKGHLGLFSLDMTCALAVSAIDLLFPYFSKRSMELFLPNYMFKTFFTVMAIFVAAYLLKACLYYIITYWGHRMGTFIEADLRDELFGHIEKLSFSFFDKNRTGQLMSRVTNDLFEITELSHHGPEDLFISCVTIIGAFCILCTIEWRLALIVFAVIPCFVIFSVILRRKMAEKSTQVKVRTSEINASIESGFSGIRTAKAFANEDIEMEKFRDSNKKYLGAKKDYYKIMGIFGAGMEFALSLLSVLVIAAGGYFIMKDSMNYIELVTFSLYVSTFISPVRKLVAFIEQYMAGMAGFKRFLEIMRTDPEIEDKPDAIILENVKGNISIKNVSFSYAPTKEDEEAPAVLNNINVKIPAGSCFAVVGPSGGGKTTLCHLIPRFYEVSDGAIMIDGVDVRDVTQHSLRQSIGIVQQDVFMFAGTIRENIAYGKPDATMDEIIEAAKRAEIHNEIMEMPNGYDSYIGERGVMLSGGQKQRIGIARVFLKNPPILILDEATSALDSMTEIRIQSAFDELAKGRTSIIIAHRLSTIRNADMIAVIDDNKVQEIGNHTELMKKGGQYAHLVEAQTIASGSPVTFAEGIV